MARKKSTADRFPCGKLRPDRSPAAIRQLVALAEKRLVDPMFGTQIGVLHLQKEISASMVSAARHFAEMMGAYDAVMGNPSRSARSPDYQAGRSDRSSGAGAETDPDRIERLREFRRRVDEALGAPHSREWRVLYDVTLLDQHCHVMDRPALAGALQELVFLFGYEARQRAVDARRPAA